MEALELSFDVASTICLIIFALRFCDFLSIFPSKNLYVLLEKGAVRRKPFMWAMTDKDIYQGTHYANVNIQLIGSDLLLYHWCIV